LTEQRKTQTNPSAGRLIEALRDTGYSLETAIADLVDNSIAAESTFINILMEYRNGNPLIMVQDNGIGMDEQKLDDAMAYGSSERLDAEISLGKFGLGLKTASSSQARRFTVFSVSEQSKSSATWDLDHVSAIDSWELVWDHSQQSDVFDIIKTFPKNKKSDTAKTGTVVLWEKVDRVMKQYKDPEGSAARKKWDSIVKNLTSHLGMTFGEFIGLQAADGVTRSPISLLINGTPITPWDPFCQWSSKTRILDKRKYEIIDEESENVVGSFSLISYAIPHQSQLTKTERQLAEVGTGQNAVRYQGIYAYRHGRMLAAGNWFRLRSKEPHVNNLRIKLDFGSDLDEDLQLDFKKTRIVFSPNVRSEMKDIVSLISRDAENFYRNKGLDPEGMEEGTDESIDIHEDSNTVMSNFEPEGLDVTPIDIPTLDDENDANLTNASGTHRIQIRVSESNSDEVEERVQAVESLHSELLYLPALVGGKKAVQLNRSHDFYRRLYYPNRNNRSVILGLDGLFYALAMAELQALPGSSAQEYFEDLRHKLSRQLKKYARNELPELTSESDNE
jgi:hypothetical protein